MSSWLSRTTHVAKESMGFSARTVDPDVEGCNAKLALLEKDVGLLRKSLETFSLTLTQHTPAARAQMSAVMMRLGETFVADGAHYASFREAQETLDGPCVEKLLTTFEAAVLQPMEEWVATFAEAKTGAVELDKLRVTFDHYREKLATLKKEKEAVILKGKVFDKGSEEKLARNADKLKESEAAYNDQRDATLARMLVVFEEAGHRLDFILMRTMQYQKQVLEDSLRTIKPWDAIVPGLLKQAKDRHLGSQSSNRLTPLISLVREHREANKRLPIDKPMPGTAPSASVGAAAAGGGGGGGGSGSGSSEGASAKAEPAPIAMSTFFAAQVAPSAPLASAAAAAATAGALKAGNPFSAAAPAASAPAAAAAAVAFTAAAAAAAAPVTGSGNPFGAGFDAPAPKAAAAPPSSSPGNPFGEPQAAAAAPAAAAVAAAGPSADEFDPFGSLASGASSSASSTSGAAFDPFGSN